MIKEDSQNSNEEALTMGTCHNALFEGLGWKIRLQQKRANYFLTLAKEIVLGNVLKKGDEVFYYLVDCEGRKALLVFLDGKERVSTNHVQLNGTTFQVRR